MASCCAVGVLSACALTGYDFGEYRAAAGAGGERPALGPSPLGQAGADAGTAAPCRPLTCAEAGAQCGSVRDGCGGMLDCGRCPAPNECGGGGVPNRCGCTPQSCQELGAECGTVDDGCGNSLSCGECGALLLCGVLAPNRCGISPCVPLTCRQLDAECGVVGDGCGGTIDCGGCKADEVCGAKEPHRCHEPD